ncbi:MAG TPA: CpsB/CapC family capsule biosynthesis tyrosine phosphatase [Gemmataceae bacterium]|nr:CpsB/CapC family capsule biosynthesis tyrosine phosphatase [Gemmataceae bacterium]
MTMLDIHYHLLPGVDDGPASLEESLALARFSVADGVTHVIATPHCHQHLRLLRADVLPRVATMNEELARAKIPLVVFPGSEIQLTDVEQYQRDHLAGVYCHLGDDPGFTLLEFPWSDESYPTGAPEHIRWLRDHNTVPIIAHPERHAFFREDAKRLRDLVQNGAWIQVTVDSLLGNFGPKSQESGFDLVRMYPDTVLASDTHGPHRCSGLSAGYQVVRTEINAARETELRSRADSILEHILTKAKP